MVIYGNVNFLYVEIFGTKYDPRNNTRHYIKGANRMKKLYMIRVEREIDDDYIYHVRQENYPTDEEITDYLSDLLNDKPDTMQYQISVIES